ncbi:MAG TPA: arginine deiminase-related protein [Egibacteraceae bacterium]|nr:arginine deiminase-related protein [Egibacteraceae bacterium]
MCRPEHFAVTYAINPWMDPSQPVDRSAALRQWDELVATYRGLGHEVLAVDPVPGLPDMVFAANAAFVIDGIALGARFAKRERADEARLYREYLQAAGITVKKPTYVNEGEGDLLLESDVILAGTGFRTDARSHDEVAALTGRQVVTLRLVDPRYYHLDTALCVLGDGQIAYLPEAFDGESRTQLARRYPDAILAEVADAEVLGLNAVSDGRNVVINREAENLAAALAARGYNPIPVDLSELRKAGGGPKCCTLELGGFRPTGR